MNHLFDGLFDINEDAKQESLLAVLLSAISGATQCSFISLMYGQTTR